MFRLFKKPLSEKLPYFMYFTWLPVEAVLSIFNVGFFVIKFFEKELMKTKQTAISAELYAI
jgi:hypothetical protein